MFQGHGRGMAAKQPKQLNWSSPMVLQDSSLSSSAIVTKAPRNRKRSVKPSNRGAWVSLPDGRRSSDPCVRVHRCSRCNAPGHPTQDCPTAGPGKNNGDKGKSKGKGGRKPDKETEDAVTRDQKVSDPVEPLGNKLAFHWLLPLRPRQYQNCPCPVSPLLRSNGLQWTRRRTLPKSSGPIHSNRC